MDRIPKSGTIESTQIISLGDSSTQAKIMYPFRKRKRSWPQSKRKKKGASNKKEKILGWTLDPKRVKPILNNHLVPISDLGNLFGVQLSNLISTLPSDPQEDSIVLPTATILAMLPILLPREVCKMLNKLEVAPG